MPVVYPNFIEKICIKLKDKDLIGWDETLGCYYYNIIEVEKGNYSKPHWCYFYGGPDNAPDKKLLKFMNWNPKNASRMKGAIILSLKIENSDDPKFSIEKMSSEEV